MIRTTPVSEGTKPYAWGVESVYQCTWYSYYRALEVGMSAPCYWDRATKTGSYTNAKDWLENYREPWEVKDLSYTPKAGDILVYDGEFGHVIFMETDVMTSEYRNGDPNSFRNAKLGDFKGDLLGILHYPYEPLNPVERNENVAQIETTDDSLRIRTEPSLEAEIVGHVQIGYYNVLDSKENDGYTWYEIAKDRWCADITTKYLPGESSDFVKEIEKWANDMVTTIKTKDKTIDDMKQDFEKISEVAEKWKT